MPIETERKFLAAIPSNIHELESVAIKQGYLCSSKTAVTRIRTAGNKGIVTIKGRREGISRPEYEYEIPYDDAVELLELCEHKLSKVRYFYPHNDVTWEIDVFKDTLAPLVLAEVECDAGDIYNLDLPPFILIEVSDQKQYSNHSLCRDGLPIPTPA